MAGASRLGGAKRWDGQPVGRQAKGGPRTPAPFEKQKSLSPSPNNSHFFSNQRRQFVETNYSTICLLTIQGRSLQIVAKQMKALSFTFMLVAVMIVSIVTPAFGGDWWALQGAIFCAGMSGRFAPVKSQP